MEASIRHWGEYVALRGVTAVLRALPLEVAIGAGGALWRGVAPVTSRHRRAARHLAAMMPETTPAAREQILRAMWGHLGQSFVEALVIDRLAAEPARIALDDAALAVRARTVAEGAINVVPHLGSWEAIVLPVAAAGAWHAAVYRRPNNPLVDAHLLATRGRYFPAGLFAKGDGAARALMRHARAGGSIAIMADLRDISGVDVPFFGRPAPSAKLPAMLARTFGRPLFAACLIRTAIGRYEMQTAEIAVPSTHDRHADIVAATADTQRVFEGWVRRWPEQWMWAHRRYRD
jgi:KDO2-lipid IV(A) lauroyltransferase